jgi:hypothetical protein
VCGGSLTEKIRQIFWDWVKTVFMEDSENGGKGEIQERNRIVVNLPHEKVEREVLSCRWSSTSRKWNSADGRPTGRRKSKATKQPLAMANLAKSLYNALVQTPTNKRVGKKKKSEGNTVDNTVGNKVSLTFTGKDKMEYSQINLGLTDNAGPLCILPEDVEKVTCVHLEDNDLIFTWTFDNYEQKVDGLPPNHPVVKVLQKNNIKIPKKKQAATLGDHEV